jgi:hypothetical protein
MKIEIYGRNLKKVKRQQARKLLHKLFDILTPYRKSGNNALISIEYTYMDKGKTAKGSVFI